MIRHALALGAAALFSVQVAHAAPYIDTITGIGSVGYDGHINGVVAAGDSFYASSLDFVQVSVALSADTPSDGGSIMVYLVPNAGGSSGIFGTPDFTSEFLLGTILDSELAPTSYVASHGGATATGSVVTLFQSVPVSFETANDEYWLIVKWGNGSSAELYWDTNDSGIGTPGQGIYYLYGDTDPVASDVDGTYAIAVSAPEPTTLAILGCGLVGIGLARRRASRNPTQS
ncbi:MAG TPA: PEP-CTERM sorting domain-containing protein [Rhodopila sp.]|jgi:hypothetical protein|nr:PEP-CTERM sorting domain-containing protein [Rhodopila sp.]